MGRRLKLIAAQAVVVGALVIVVSLTLLRGEEGNPLFDIVAPGGSEISAGPDPGEDRANDAATGPPAGSAQAAPEGSTPPLGLVPDPATPADPVAPGSEGDDPTGDQYADTIARLTQQLQ